MATPANRVPVRIARGSKANLDTAIAAGDLKEGEICYATDENGIYVVESGVLTQAGADLASTSIDALSDVDTTTAAPTDGQVLIWNNVDGEWQPGDRLADVVSDTTPQLGGNLDVNGSYIVSTSGGDVEIAPDTTGDLVVRGNDTDGSITLNCTANTHGVKIQSPPHSAAATYTLVLPDDTGTNGQALITDGSGGLSWAAPNADLSATSIDALSDVDTTTAAPTDGQALVWDNAASQWEPGTVGADLSTSSIDALSDVDTTTVAPTDGQALVWDNANSKWEPGTVSGGGGAVTSVNTQTGDVALGIEDMDDFSLQPGTFPYWATKTTVNTSPASGEWFSSGTNIARLAPIDSNGTDWTTELTALSTGPSSNFWYSTNGSTWTAAVNDGGGAFDNMPTWLEVYVSPLVTSSHTGGIYISFSDPSTVPGAALVDGDLLQYDTTDSKFKPVQLGIDDLTDVDTTTAAPTDGQALVWDNANSQWEPGTISGGGAVDSVNSQTGTVSLGIEDMDDFALQPGTFPYWATKEVTGTPSAGEWFANGSVLLRVNPVDSNGTDWSTEMTTLGVSGSATFWYSTDGTSWTQTVNDGGFDNLPTWFQFDLDPFSVNAHSGGFYISFSDPASAPGQPLANGDVLQYDSSDSKFKPVAASSIQPVTSVNSETGAVSLGIQDMNDYSEPAGYVFDTFQVSSNPNEPGEYHFQQPGVANNLAFAKEDANGAATDAIKNLSIGSTVYLNGVAFTTDGAGGGFSGAGSVGSWYLPIAEDLSSVATTGLTITLEPPLSDGDVLRYSSTASAFKPAGASGLRSMLGIEEYADDTAAGAGGLASGEMYYNTTSSSYVLKT